MNSQAPVVHLIVYSRYITTRNGKRIPHPNGGTFRFCIARGCRGDHD